ncbi:MAG: class I SAM-dependent methyltransferase, partial [Candidatus Binatia bacterium]
AQLAGLEQTQSTHAQQLAGLHEASERLRTQADVLRRRVAAAGEAPPAGARSAALAPAPMPAVALDDTEAAVDTWLVSQAFRGTEEALGDRQRQYVPHFAGRRDVLDIGCGRGEFLLLLREAGIAARGVDSDRDMALWCQEKGLDVTCTDALTYLAHQPEASLGGIFCAQVAEHLATPDLLRFIHLAHRALRPDGLLLIETLNPESLLVLYRWFWVDLTHERLVHPETLKFVLQSCGFRDIDLHFVPPPDGPLRLPLLELPGAPPEGLARFNAATQYLNDLLYGSFDYAVMGIR